jgi:hypothetical protein
MGVPGRHSSMQVELLTGMRAPARQQQVQQQQQLRRPAGRRSLW